MRLIRTILFLTGAGVLLPSPPENIAASDPSYREVSTVQMLTSASSAFYDVASFCVREPGVCDTANYVAGRLEAKAKYSVRLLYEWATDATSPPAATQEAIKVDMMKTGATQMAAAEVPPQPAAQSTLKIEDLIPEWRGPVPQKVSAPKKEG